MAILGLDWSTVLLVCVVFLAIQYLIQQHFHHSDSHYNLPPGPKGWPILGNLPSLDPSEPYKSLNKLADKYGPVFRLRFGSFPVVVLNNFEAVKEAFVTNGDDYDDRPKMMIFDLIVKGKGLICSYSGHLQRTRRRFALQAMRNLGMGKFRLEEQITEESKRLTERFCSHGGKPFCPFSDLDKAFCNVICYVAFGKLYEYDDPKFHAMLKHLERSFEVAKFSGISNFIPIFKHLPFGGFSEMKEIDKYGRTFLGNLIKDVTDNYVKGDPRNIIDMYYDFKDNLVQDGEDDAEKLDEMDLLRTVGDLFIAGTETSATTLKWTLLYMVLNPSIQEKVQCEMDDVVGRSRLPSLKDRLNLPYTEAAIMEIQRIASIVPLSVPRGTSTDTHLFGYDIPKGTLILPNIWGILHDETLWKNPHTFNPERFLDEDGDVIRSKELIPFSLGRRKCLGEQLAIMELFLFITHLLHRFKFSLPEGAPPPSLKGVMGASLSPEYYDICATPRPLN